MTTPALLASAVTLPAFVVDDWDRIQGTRHRSSEQRRRARCELGLGCQKLLSKHRCYERMRGSGAHDECLDEWVKLCKSGGERNSNVLGHTRPRTVSIDYDRDKRISNGWSVFHKTRIVILGDIGSVRARQLRERMRVLTLTITEQNPSAMLKSESGCASFLLTTSSDNAKKDML